MSRSDDERIERRSHGLRLVVGVAAVISGTLFAVLQTFASATGGLQWALIALGIFLLGHLAIDKFWTSGGGGGRPAGLPPNPLKSVIGSAGAIVGLVAVFGSDIATTTLVGTTALVISLLVGIVLLGLPSRAQGSLAQGTMMVVLRFLLLSSFAFGSICVASALISKGSA